MLLVEVKSLHLAAGYTGSWHTIQGSSHLLLLSGLVPVALACRLESIFLPSPGQCCGTCGTLGVKRRPWPWSLAPTVFVDCRTRVNAKVL